MAHPTDWLSEAGFGTMTHYLAESFAKDGSPMTRDRWNRLIDDFDVEKFADTIAGTGSRYHLFTIAQNSGFACSPNATYDRYLGRSAEASWFPQRDLIAEIAEALAMRGVRTMAYSTSTAANDDHAALRALKCLPPWEPQRGWGKAWRALGPHPEADDRLADFQRMWQDIHRKWSQRWGDRISGWWIDGCFSADKMYEHDDAPNFASFVAALKSGNPDSIVAFNPGLMEIPPRRGFVGFTREQDYLAGECDHLVTDFWSRKLSRFIDGQQLHALSFLGGFWGRNAPTPRFTDELAAAYTRYIHSYGGAVTWDIPIQQDGAIPDAFVLQLTAIGKAMNR